MENRPRGRRRICPAGTVRAVHFRMSAQLVRLRSGLGFLQHCNDLFFAKSLRFHCPLPLSGLYYRSGLNSGLRSNASCAMCGSPIMCLQPALLSPCAPVFDRTSGHRVDLMVEPSHRGQSFSLRFFTAGAGRFWRRRGYYSHSLAQRSHQGVGNIWSS